MDKGVHTPPPVETDAHNNVGVHLSYIRRDLDALTQNQVKNAEETQKLLKEIRDGVPSRKEFDELRGHVDGKAGGGDLAEIKKFVETRLVTKEDFDPVKKVVYGMVSAVLGTVILAILALIITNK